MESLQNLGYLEDGTLKYLPVSKLQKNEPRFSRKWNKEVCAEDIEILLRYTFRNICESPTPQHASQIDFDRSGSFHTHFCVNGVFFLFIPECEPERKRTLLGRSEGCFPFALVERTKSTGPHKMDGRRHAPIFNGPQLSIGLQFQPHCLRGCRDGERLSLGKKNRGKKNREKTIEQRGRKLRW